MITPFGKKTANFACVQPSQKGPAIGPLSMPLLKYRPRASHGIESPRESNSESEP